MSDMSDFNKAIVDEFRANAGKVGGGFEGAPMILVHHRGAKSGTERVSPLVYQAVGDSFVVFGSNAFLHFIPTPPLPQNLAGDFLKVFFASGYVYVIGAMQLVGGTRVAFPADPAAALQPVQDAGHRGRVQPGAAGQLAGAERAVPGHQIQAVQVGSLELQPPADLVGEQ